VSEGHHLLGDVQVEAVAGDVGVEGVEVPLRDPVHSTTRPPEITSPAPGRTVARVSAIRPRSGSSTANPVEVDRCWSMNRIRPTGCSGPGTVIADSSLGDLLNFSGRISETDLLN